MEKALRNTLRIMVTQARKILEVAIQEQLQGVFGIHVNGNIEPATAMAHLSPDDQGYREQLLIHLQHIRASGFTMKDAIEQLIREVSYTHLNRLSAYKMMEKRKIISETVSRGLKSRGFIFYVDEHPEEEKLWSSGKQDVAYLHFLEWRGEKLSEEIGVLFSSSDPANRLFPFQHILDEVLALINSDELQDIWSEDEAIGWVYQYFTPKELRDKARNESQTPRNSYELAFRNQFYTPSYVVKFLTDNTLGRIWYEMHQGKTCLTEQCTYMVRRPDEVFFAKADSPRVEEAQHWLQGEDVPEPDIWSLAHTVNAYNRVRNFGEGGNEWVEKQLLLLTDNGIKELKTQELLDLLFLFCRKERFSEGTLVILAKEIEAIMAVIRERVSGVDKDNRSQEELQRTPFFIIYRQMKDPRNIKILDPACGSGHFLLYCFDLLEKIYLEAYEDDELSPALQRDYPRLEDLKSAIPGLILAHNLHGIDIDLRATQIASLALWLRAQRAYQDLGVKSSEHLKIARSNIVCAEPMPGEKDLLKEFTATLQPKILGKLVETIFDKMRLASETGSLLKIEIEIKEAILAAKQLWLMRPKAEQLALWYGSEKADKKRQSFDDTEVTDIAFWNEAESQVIKALHTYATSVPKGSGLARRLFADDAVQGFAFIDICQKLFDVVLMNPPFGEALPSSSKYINYHYPFWNGNLLCAFIERGWEMLASQGLLGAIYDRTAIVKSTYESFRRNVLVPDNRLAAIADLGWNVLDANVEVTTSVLNNTSSFNKGAFIDVRNTPSDAKGEDIVDVLKDFTKVGNNTRVVLTSSIAFQKLPNAVIGYDFPQFLTLSFIESPSLEDVNFKAFQGHALKADKHFRVWWEISTEVSRGFRARMFNGAGFSPYSTPLYDCVIASTSLESLPKDTATILRNKNAQMLPGVCFGKRGEYFCAHVLPVGYIFTVEGQSIPIANQEVALELLGLLNTPLVRLSLNKYCGQHKYSGYVNLFPYRRFTDINSTQAYVKSALAAYKEAQKFDEVQLLFSSMFCDNSVGAYATSIEKAIMTAWDAIKSCEVFCHKESLEAYCVSEPERKLIESFQKEQPKLESPVGDVDINTGCKWFAAHSIISHGLGCILGRWDIRIAKNPSLLPKLPDFFDPLPNCSPNLLIGPDGLPATPDHIVSEEWLHARPDAISLPEKGSVKKPIIPDLDYPLAINWDGFLVDDPEHPEDIIRHIQDVLRVIWQAQADAIELDICQILSVKELRNYFRKSGNDSFWTDHLQRYSKSRRKAPIYWLLQSSKKNYAIWLYYHRLNKDTLFRILNTFVEPKIRLEETQLEQLRLQLTNAGTGGREVKQLEQLLERQENFISELEDFRDKLRRAADLNLEPDLNDGVVLNIAPLWELVPWNEAKRYWQELRMGKYEWSTIAKQLREKGLA